MNAGIDPSSAGSRCSGGTTGETEGKDGGERPGGRCALGPQGLTHLLLDPHRARRRIMTDLANRPLTTLAATVVGSLVVFLNLFLLYRMFMGA